MGKFAVNHYNNLLPFRESCPAVKSGDGQNGNFSLENFPEGWMRFHLIECQFIMSVVI